MGNGAGTPPWLVIQQMELANLKKGGDRRSEDFKPPNGSLPDSSRKGRCGW